jgi:hypothetical protein
MRNRRVALVVVIAALCGASSFAAQEQTTSSPCMAEYENHNQIDYGPLVVREVRGTVSDPQQTAMPKVCLTVFTEKDHKSVATTETDANGRFSFQSVPPGRYRLIVKADALCTANIPLHVVSRLKRKQVLQVHMKPRGLDTCSYGEAVQAGASVKREDVARSVASTTR